jgi:signal transduction histidine kinase
MTTTYLIHAWCVRPFIAVLDIDAATPQKAIAAARRRQDHLLDTAEECYGKYPWDEFAVYDESGNELLHVRDDEARMRDAAPSLREALRYVAQVLADFKPDSLRQLGLDVALKEVEAALAMADQAISPARPDDPCQQP